MDSLSISSADLVVLVLVVSGALVGFRSGALPQILGLAGAGAAVWGIISLAPQLVDALSGVEQPTRAILAIGGTVVVLATADAIGSGIGGALRARLLRGVGGCLDSAIGALFGVGQAGVAIWLVGGLLATASVPVVSAELQKSVAVRALLETLPPPGDLVAELGAVLTEAGLPQVFVGLEPLPAPPVDAPGTAQATQIAAAAIRSTVRVDAQACGATLTGTGFSVAAGYFVTNAHVVAGSTRVTLTGAAATARGTVVLFDPDLDVAVIRAATLRLPALDLAQQIPERGAVGATLGFPEGGDLTVLPAAVTAQIRARGRDLYGQAPVVRDILELRAAVQPGDSGGPLVLTDGTVGGVVFAESRTDDAIGYALDPTAVAVAIGPGIGDTSAADTGPCIQ